jgi:hypothetical protein
MEEFLEYAARAAVPAAAIFACANLVHALAFGGRPLFLFPTRWKRPSVWLLWAFVFLCIPLEVGMRCISVDVYLALATLIASASIVEVSVNAMLERRAQRRARHEDGKP